MQGYPDFKMYQAGTVTETEAQSRGEETTHKNWRDFDKNYSVVTSTGSRTKLTLRKIMAKGSFYGIVPSFRYTFQISFNF